MRVGILGAGAIAPPYYAAIAAWPQLELVACASQSGDSAARMAQLHGIRAMPVAAMLADPAIDAVVNLTPAQAHYSTSRAILEAGKHLYSEKPLAVTFTQARALVESAEGNGLRIGCAPDTFLGAAHQAARAAIDAGEIGRPVSGAVFLGHAGSEVWHPHPAPLYASGGGPVSDHGPYYLTHLIHLLGPVESVCALGTTPHLQRRTRDGGIFPVEVPTTVGALLSFACGALVTVALSWDIQRHRRQPIEIYGTAGTLLNPDPNWADGAVLVSDGANEWRTLDHADRPFHAPTMITFQGDPVGYYRLSGLADMADAIHQCRPHRANGQLALHVVEIIDAIAMAIATGRRVDLVTRCERPAPVEDDIDHARTYRPFGPGLLDARTLF